MRHYPVGNLAAPPIKIDSPQLNPNNATNMKATQPHQNITDINSVVLAKISRRIPSTSQKLKSTSERITATAHADPKVARAFATTLNRKGTSVGAAAAIINKLAKDVHSICLPCNTIKGAVYVKATDVDKVTELFDTATSDLAKAKEDIRSEWPWLIQEAKTRLGDLTMEVEFPDVEEFIDGYFLGIDWLGIPAPVENTVLESVSSEVASRVRASSEQSVKNMMRSAHGRPVRDLIKIMAESVTQIRDGKRIRQERFDNIVDAIERCDALNWLDIPELRSLTRNLKQTCTVKDAPSMTAPERADAAQRIASATEQAERTLSRLGI